MEIFQCEIKMKYIYLPFSDAVSVSDPTETETVASLSLLSLPNISIVILSSIKGTA